METKAYVYVVPDYVCTGVKEHYVKVSVKLMPHGSVFSVILNKKTEAIQRQAKVTTTTPKQMNRAIYGYGNPFYFAVGTDDMRSIYDKLSIEERRQVKKCVKLLFDAKERYFKKQERILNLKFEEKNAIHNMICRYMGEYGRIERNEPSVNNVGHGEVIYDDSVNAPDSVSAAKENAAANDPVPYGTVVLNSQQQAMAVTITPAQNTTASPIVEPPVIPSPVISSPVTEPPPVEPPKMESIVMEPTAAQPGTAVQQPLTGSETPVNKSVREMKLMARMKNAEGLTEFCNGNIYKVKPISDIYIFGKSYIVLYNDHNEERLVNMRRIDLVPSYQEPPKEQAPEE